MSEANSKLVNGQVYKQPNSIRKLATLVQNIPYEIVKVNPTKTRFNSYIVTIEDTDEYEELNVWMPEYIVRNAWPGKRFLYDGLKSKEDGSGHSYHSILWAKNK